jgi:hypothetical protein
MNISLPTLATQEVIRNFEESRSKAAESVQTGKKEARMRKLPLIFLITVLLPALPHCAGSSRHLAATDYSSPGTARDEATHQITGTWGGEGARLATADGRTSIEFPCAEGHIDHLIQLDSSGAFNEEGTLQNEQGTVLRDEVAAQQGSRLEKVRFTGRLTGEVLTISIQYGDRKSRAIEYSLTRGAEGHVPRCP